MPIHVICPSCHARFKVGDQHGGKTGACPKCKGQIQIPKAEDEVIIHAPESEAGAKDAKGRNVLKPIKRKETKFQLNAALMIGGAVVLVTAIAFLLGNSREQLAGSLTYILAGGAVLLGPALAYAGYTFLRDDEMGAFVGTDLLIRSVGCGLVYALTWGVYWYVGYTVFGSEPYSVTGLEIWQIGVLVGIAIGIGTFAAFVAFDFDPMTGFFHFALFFVATILLRFLVEGSFLPGMNREVKKPGARATVTEVVPQNSPATINFLRAPMSQRDVC
jgi:Zn-finger nucleic acid-binding protein